MSEQGRFVGYEWKTIDPHQFLGLEVNPRAAAIAELVLWIGFLQWHFRTRGGVPPEPILKDFKTIQVTDAVLRGRRLRAMNGARGDGSEGIGELSLQPASGPEWPAADYIVGNPPFIGGKDIRGRWARAMRRRFGPRIRI